MLKTKNIILLLFAVLYLTSCDKTRNEPGWDYFPDMVYSEAYDAYSENPNFKNGITLRKPVEGTVPMHMVPNYFEKTDESRILAGKEIKNPLAVNAENLSEGKVLYDRFCLSCHGEKGDGKGFLYTSGKYLVPPKTLISDELKIRPDGEIYHTISVGIGVMGAHGSMISPKDRWKIVNYIRENLQKNSTNASN